MDDSVRVTASAYDPETLSVGVLGRPHGIRGELILRPHDPESRRAGRRSGACWLVAGRRRDPTLEVASCARSPARYLVRLVGVDDRDAAAALTPRGGAGRRAPRSPRSRPASSTSRTSSAAPSRPKTGARSASRARRSGTARTTCVAVDGADGRERLSRWSADFVLDVDAPRRKMRVRWKATMPDAGLARDLTFEIVTLFPELFDGLLGDHRDRQGDRGRHRRGAPDQPARLRPGRLPQVDDTPYGGGPGMVMRVEPHRGGAATRSRRRAARRTASC